MHELNKRFKADPLAFMNRLIMVTLPAQPCPTCHCVMDLGQGGWAVDNVYARPEPMVLTFDFVAGAFGGNIPAGQTFGQALGAAAPAGLAFTNAAANYAALQVMKVGLARVANPVGRWTRQYTAYWLPWATQGANELHLNDPHVRFFFTAMFSGCTFCVATPAGGAGPANVWVTHIAWDPGVNAPAAWGGAALAGGVNVDARRLSAERAFYTARMGAGTNVRSVALRPDALPGFAGVPPVAAVPITALGGPLPAMHGRYCYGDNPALVPNPGIAFIAGWRDDNDHWHFAVQKHPGGFTALGAPMQRAVHTIVPQGVQQFL
ncbi:hypothetical protein HUA74_39470 [Myxococcus sp. CA051A]|uniref:hypothetical protein n=1 Tax=unclassified Myxococcus TaxID=2648731 RepID=UPI00157BB1E9|nr:MULTISPECIES: hypothetical protein [unclassified Myxococcus]NTX17327.1 hypothetical protein [Myxococcus sp. CA056]NTX66746.1 hypothetical protein [Myxococcus sp. CA051A]